jgi:hypothetical protein
METNPRRFIGLASVTVILLAGTAEARPVETAGEAGAGPCDALVAYLRDALAGRAPVVAEYFDREYHSRESRLEDRLRSTSPTTPPAYAALVTPACRAETRRGAAPAAPAAARAWTQRPERGWIDRGRIVLCTMQDPGSLDELATWLADLDHPEARAVCVSELATWPGAEPRPVPILAGAVRQTRSFREPWEIDEAVVAAANAMGTPELREELVPVLAAAHARHAVGYDRLRVAVCTNDGAMSVDRARACSTLPTEAEREWPPNERSPWPVRVGATALYAYALAAAFDGRDHDASRKVATAAGVGGGAMAALTAVAVVSVHLHLSDDEANSLGFESVILGSAIAGGVLGGLSAHALAASPGARGPVTAVGLAPLYIFTIAMTIE